MDFIDMIYFTATGQEPSSLSDFGIVGCECAAAVHFLPSSCPIAALSGGESGKNWPRWGTFSLSTPKVRQAPSAPMHAMMNAIIVTATDHGLTPSAIAAR